MSGSMKRNLKLGEASTAKFTGNLVSNEKKRCKLSYLKLFNTRTGDVLISVKPHVAALSNDNLETYCSNCFGPGSEPLRRCTGCKAILYCDSVSLRPLSRSLFQFSSNFSLEMSKCRLGFS